MNIKTKILTSTAVAVALTGGIGATLALADTPTPAPSPSSTSSPSTSSPSPGQQDPSTEQKKKGSKKHKSLEARALHGEVTVGGKKQRVIEFQRGTVEKVSATSLTVKSKDGFAATYVLTAQTKVRKEKKAATLSEIETSDVVRIVAVQNGSTSTATTIRDRG